MSMEKQIMTIDKSLEFLVWLDAQETAQNLTDYEISKQGKFSHSALSRARVEGIPPGWDICMKISGVLNVSPITVFRKAGLLPPGPDDKVNFEDWQYLLAQMTPDERDELMQIGTMKVERRQKQESLKSLKPRKAG